MIATCGDLDDVRPVADIALPVGVVSHGAHGAVELKPHRAQAACGDLDDVRPVADIALLRVVDSHGDHRAVGLKPHRVTVAYGDLDDVCPVADIALPRGVVSRGDRHATGLKPHRMIATCGYHRDVLRSKRKVGGNRVVIVHGDGSCGIINISNGAHIASPVDKVVARLRLSQQVDHCASGVGKGPHSRGGH